MVTGRVGLAFQRSDMRRSHAKQRAKRKRSRETWALGFNPGFGPLGIYFTGREEGREHLQWVGGRYEGPLGPLLTCILGDRLDFLPKGLLDVCPLDAASDGIKVDRTTFRRVLKGDVKFLLTEWDKKTEEDYVAGLPPNVVLPAGGLQERWERLLWGYTGLPDNLLQRIRIVPGLVTSVDEQRLNRLHRRASNVRRMLEVEGPKRPNGARQAQTEPERYIGQKTRMTYVWHVHDLVAGAWAEVVHTLKTRGTATECKICRELFLRAHGYRTTRCPICQKMSERQKAKAEARFWADMKASVRRE